MRYLRKTLLLLTLVLLAACDTSSKPQEQKVVDMGSIDNCAALPQCLLRRDGVEMRFELGRNLRPMQPFHLQFHIDGTEKPVDSVIAEFFMEGMDMGVNRYRLIRTGNGWEGEITLPVCLSGRSSWRAVIEAASFNQRFRGVFRFHASR